MIKASADVPDARTWLRLQLYCTALVTLGIWGFLAWDYFHGGVPSHHLLADKTLPKVSNWWGGLLLPLLTWLLLARVHKRVSRAGHESPEAANSLLPVLYGLTGGLLFGTLLSVFFSFNYTEVAGNMLMGLFLVALFLPIYRAECLLGLVLGMTYTFGGVLPTGIGTILMLLGAMLYLVVRPAIRYVASRLSRALSPAN